MYLFLRLKDSREIRQKNKFLTNIDEFTVWYTKLDFVVRLV